MSAVRPLRRLSVALVLLAGVFAMHGLGTHGDEVATQAPAAMAVMAHDGMDAHGPQTGTDHAGDHGMPMGHPGLLGLCVALVAGAFVLALRHRAGVLHVLALRARALRTTTPVALLTPRAPPDRVALRVHRC